MRLITFLSKAWKKKKTLAPQKKLRPTDELSFLLKFYFDKMRILKSAHVSLICKLTAAWIQNTAYTKLIATPISQLLCRSFQRGNERSMDLQRRPEAREYLNGALAWRGEGDIHHASLVPNATVHRGDHSIYTFNLWKFNFNINKGTHLNIWMNKAALKI